MGVLLAIAGTISAGKELLRGLQTAPAAQGRARSYTTIGILAMLCPRRQMPKTTLCHGSAGIDGGGHGRRFNLLSRDGLFRRTSAGPTAGSLAQARWTARNAVNRGRRGRGRLSQLLNESGANALKSWAALVFMQSRARCRDGQ